MKIMAKNAKTSANLAFVEMDVSLSDDGKRYDVSSLGKGYKTKSTLISDHDGNEVYKLSTDGLQLIIDCNTIIANSHFLYMLLLRQAKNKTGHPTDHFKQDGFNPGSNGKKNGSSNGNRASGNVRPRESNGLEPHNSKVPRNSLHHAKGSPASPGGVVMPTKQHQNYNQYGDASQRKGNGSARYVSGETAMKYSGMMKEVHAAPNRDKADKILKKMKGKDPVEARHSSSSNGRNLFPERSSERDYSSTSGNLAKNGSPPLASMSSSTSSSKGRETEKGSTGGMFRGSPPPHAHQPRSYQSSSKPSILDNRRATANPFENPNDKAMRRGATSHPSKGEKQMAANGAGALGALEGTKRSNGTEWLTTLKSQKTFGTSKSTNSFTHINTTRWSKDSYDSSSGFGTKSTHGPLQLTSTASSNSSNTYSNTRSADMISIRGLGKPEMIGIKNLGNTCYMSAILQCLLALPKFKNDSKGDRAMMTQIINEGMLSILSRQPQASTSSSSKTPSSSSLQILDKPVQKPIVPASMTQGLFNNVSSTLSGLAGFNRVPSIFGGGIGNAYTNSSSSGSKVIPPKKITHATLNSCSLVQQLRTFIDLKPNKNITNSKDFKDAIDSKVPYFKGYCQQDAHEFVMFLLDCIQEEYCGYIRDFLEQHRPQYLVRRLKTPATNVSTASKKVVLSQSSQINDTGPSTEGSGKTDRADISDSVELESVQRLVATGSETPGGHVNGKTVSEDRREEEDQELEIVDDENEKVSPVQVTGQQEGGDQELMLVDGEDDSGIVSSPQRQDAMKSIPASPDTDSKKLTSPSDSKSGKSPLTSPSLSTGKSAQDAITLSPSKDGSSDVPKTPTANPIEVAHIPKIMQSMIPTYRSFLTEVRVQVVCNTCGHVSSNYIEEHKALSLALETVQQAEDRRGMNVVEEKEEGGKQGEKGADSNGKEKEKESASASSIPVQGIDVTKKEELDLSQLLVNLFAAEFRDFNCANCEMGEKCQVNSYVRTVPKTLILHLKRFEYILKKMQEEKVESPVNIPLELDLPNEILNRECLLWPDLRADFRDDPLTFMDRVMMSSEEDLDKTLAIDRINDDSSKPVQASLGEKSRKIKSNQPIRYNLTGVLRHKGSTAKSGHYIADVLDINADWDAFVGSTSSGNDQMSLKKKFALSKQMTSEQKQSLPWIHCDDSRVYKRYCKDVLADKTSPYILFYDLEMPLDFEDQV